jgi:hypothetical protein
MGDGRWEMGDGRWEMGDGGGEQAEQRRGEEICRQYVSVPYRRQQRRILSATKTSADLCLCPLLPLTTEYYNMMCPPHLMLRDALGCRGQRAKL